MSTTTPTTKTAKFEQEAKASCSPERLRALAYVNDTMVLRSVAKNPHTPADALRKLAVNQSDDLILCSVAKNPQTPADVLMKLIYTRKLDIRFCVAQNPAVTSGILRKIAESGKDLAAILAASKL